MTASELHGFLRFLSQDAKVPLATAMTKVKELQKADLDSAEKLSKAKYADVSSIFPDEKLSKQILAAARRVTKKRAAGDDDQPKSSKKPKNESLFSKDNISPQELERSLALPRSDSPETELAETVLFTNRAPLFMAFVVTLLKHTMPDQPLSSQLSLAQAYISTTSRSRAVNLGIESGKSAEEEGFGEGQPTVTILGKKISVIRRWGYDWKNGNSGETIKPHTDAPNDDTAQDDSDLAAAERGGEPPALWALDLEALKKSNTAGSIVASVQNGTYSNLPIYMPQSARNYMLKAFDTAPSKDTPSKKVSAGAKATEKERNLGKLLKCLDELYDSWADSLGAGDLSSKTWGWYVKVRPEVADGAAGWGGKNDLKLSDILALKRG